ncbi:hypothetical protein FACS1894122_09070 [Alphaproteobacteria bacterium]|nr:hypothetical protein FACS1894122_09070 [Alphaproteobacteria bacterium]
MPSGTESTKSFYAAGMNSETGSYSPRASTSTSTGGSVIIKEIESIKETARQLLTRQENFLIMREQDAKAAAIQMANIMRAQQKRHEEEIERLRKEKLAEIERLEKERLAEIEKRIAAEKKEALHRQVMAVCLRHGLNQTNIIRRCSMKGIEKKSGIERYNAVSAIYDKTLSPFEKLFDDKNNLRSLGDFLYKNKGGKEYACFPSLAFESLIREVNGFLRTQ